MELPTRKSKTTAKTLYDLFLIMWAAFLLWLLSTWITPISDDFHDFIRDLLPW